MVLGPFFSNEGWGWWIFLEFFLVFFFRGGRIFRVCRCWESHFSSRVGKTSSFGVLIDHGLPPAMYPRTNLCYAWGSYRGRVEGRNKGGIMGNRAHRRKRIARSSLGRVERNSVDRWVKIGKGMKEGDRRKRPKAKKGKRGRAQRIITCTRAVGKTVRDYLSTFSVGGGGQSPLVGCYWSSPPSSVNLRILFYFILNSFFILFYFISLLFYVFCYVPEFWKEILKLVVIKFEFPGNFEYTIVIGLRIDWKGDGNNE